MSHAEMGDCGDSRGTWGKDLGRDVAGGGGAENNIHSLPISQKITTTTKKFSFGLEEKEKIKYGNICLLCKTQKSLMESILLKRTDHTKHLL